MTSTADSPSDFQKYRQPVMERTTKLLLDEFNHSDIPAMETVSPDEARQMMTDAQSSVPFDLPSADVMEKTITVEGNEIRLVIVRPSQVKDVLPGFMFFHGGGWVIGDFATHERFVRELVSQSGAVAVFVDYERSPEARYPVALNQVYAATQWVAEHGEQIGVDGSRLSVVGNSAGGNLAAAVALRCRLENGPPIRQQVLFWPVTDARFDTASYAQFHEGYFLTRAMMYWFWDHYTTDESERGSIWASPLRASLDQLQGLPPTLVQTAEFDVLRDEGEAYARKLGEAGVDVVCVRVNGLTHDFGNSNALCQVPAIQSAVRMAAQEIRRHLE